MFVSFKTTTENNFNLVPDCVSLSVKKKMTALRWRDTYFALLNLTASQIPIGYSLDYSLAAFNDSNFNSLISSKTDTISDAGDFAAFFYFEINIPNIV